MTLRGKAKGMKFLLMERGLWREGLLKACEKCRLKVEEPARSDCCAQRILEVQSDFLAQKSLLEEIPEAEGQ